MMAGLAFTHMDTLRPVLENPGVPLTHSSHMRSYIPHVRDMEIKKLKEEVERQFLSIIFDGTTRIGEILLRALSRSGLTTNKEKRKEGKAFSLGA